ncbi:Sphingomyelin phosphodiesterase [Pleurotus pulmonarius]
MYKHLFPAALVLLFVRLAGGTIVDDVLDALQKAVDCTSRHALLHPLQALAHLGNDAFVDLLSTICIQSGEEDPDVCTGISSAVGPIIAHDMRQISPDGRTATRLCDALFGLCDPPPVMEFQVPLPPAPHGPTKRFPSGKKVFQVAHISDVHIDHEYTVGAEADCSKNICCRVFDDSLPQVSEPAGPNGNSKCDSPVGLADSMLEAINDLKDDVKFAIFTGDVVEGATWLVDRPEVTNDLHEFNTQLASKLSIPVFPAIGNHDSAPVNSFPRSTTNTTIDSQWVFDTQGPDWAQWVHPEGAQQVIHASGSYSVIAPGSHLKVISINTQYWYKQNLWIYDSDTPQPDPNGILKFLTDKLASAERAGQRAWIIGHIPIGKEDIVEDQSNYYDQIVQRFHAAIAGQFFGHSHKDQFEIAYSDYNHPSALNAVSVALIGPALTPTSGNPAFKLYDVDLDTYEIMDVRVYFTNISDPSFQSKPQWDLYYSARDSYGPLVNLQPGQPLNPAFWHGLTEAFRANETAFQLFNTRISRGGAVSPCDASCKNVTICDMSAFRSENNCDSPTPGLNLRRRANDDANTRDVSECGGPSISSIFSRIVAKQLKTTAP